MYIKEDSQIEQDGTEYSKIILPRTGDKPLSFYGNSLYENNRQNHRYLAIYKTAPNTPITRYVVYFTHTYGGYDVTYSVFTFDNNKDAYEFIKGNRDCPTSIDMTLTGKSMLNIGVALGHCVIEELI